MNTFKSIQLRDYIQIISPKNFNPPRQSLFLVDVIWIVVSLKQDIETKPIKPKS